MTGMLTLKRWIGFALVVFILYGTTVEAAHRHGRILPTSGADSVANSEHTSSPASSKTSCGDCLICQLHQNFNTTLVVFRLVDPPASVITKIHYCTCRAMSFHRQPESSPAALLLFSPNNSLTRESPRPDAPCECLHSFHSSPNAMNGLVQSKLNRFRR